MKNLEAIKIRGKWIVHFWEYYNDLTRKDIMELIKKYDMKVTIMKEDRINASNGIGNEE